MLPTEKEYNKLIASSLLFNEEGFKHFINDEMEGLVPGECPPQPTGTTIMVTLNHYMTLEVGFPYPDEAWCFETNSPPTVGTIAAPKWQDYIKLSLSQPSLLIKGEMGQLRPKYVKYHLFYDEPYLLATNGPNKPVFTTPLYATPVPGLVPPYPHNSLSILTKDLPFNPILTATLYSLKDPSITAEVHHL
jgi:hypothetical protein